MKKHFKSISILVILVICLKFPCIAFASVNKTYPANLPYKSPEKSREELYQDIFISMLLPYIQREVDKYYSKYLIYTPMVAPYTVYILSAERPNGYRTFVFNLKLRVESYIGPHIDVGTDYITATVRGGGHVKIEKFQHIKSYALPLNYQHIIKKGYNNPIP